MKEKEKIIILISLIGGIITVLAALFLRGTVYFQTAIIIGLGITALPFIINQYLIYKWSKEIEEYLPDFLRDVAESTRSGMPLTKAIETASEGAYGALSKEMKKVSAQLSWGVPFEEALMRFAKRIKSKLARQAVLIIIESHKSGGEIADVLETVSTDIKTLKRIESERKSKLKVYLVSTYFIFFLFLGIIIALTTTFVPATPQLNEAAGLLGGTPSKLSEDDFRNFFFHLCLIQAFFAGLIGGQMGEGSALSGIKHSIILTVITIFVFQFLIAPPSFADRLADSILRIPPNSIGAKSTPTAFTVYNSLTNVELADLVKKKAEQRRLPAYKGITGNDITFNAINCGPCNRGELVVTESSVVVNAPSKIRYSIMSLGNGKYRITITGD